MARAGRPPVIESGPDADAILKEVLAPGANYRSIAERFRVSKSALLAFRKRTVTPAVQEMIDARAAQAPLAVAQRDVMARLERIVVRGESILEAADRWLRDPDDPGAYDITPRGTEMLVIYDTKADGRPVRKKATVAELIDRIETGLGVTVVSCESRVVDPRKLLLDAVNTLKPVLELLGKATGQIRPDVGTGSTGGTINIILGISTGDGNDMPPAARRLPAPIEVRPRREEGEA